MSRGRGNHHNQSNNGRNQAPQSAASFNPSMAPAAPVAGQPSMEMMMQMMQMLQQMPQMQQMMGQMLPNATPTPAPPVPQPPKNDGRNNKNDRNETGNDPKDKRGSGGQSVGKRGGHQQANRGRRDLKPNVRPHQNNQAPNQSHRQSNQGNDRSHSQKRNQPHENKKSNQPLQNRNNAKGAVVVEKTPQLLALEFQLGQCEKNIYSLLTWAHNQPGFERFDFNSGSSGRIVFVSELHCEKAENGIKAVEGVTFEKIAKVHDHGVKKNKPVHPASGTQLRTHVQLTASRTCDCQDWITP